MTETAQPWTAVCDFDGTIAPVDVTDKLLEAYAEPGWLEIEAAWLEGTIGSRECLSRQVALVKAPLRDIDRLADTIAIDPHFLDFAGDCAAQGIRLIVVSDGLDRMIERILSRHRLGHLEVFANALLTVGPKTHRMLSPHQDPFCLAASGTCKCAVIQDVRDELPGTRVLFVGDGRSDFCAAARASDVVAAKSKLLAHMKTINQPCRPFTTFADVRRILSDLTSGAANFARTSHGLHHECT